MGKVTELTEKYKAGDLTFEELREKLVTFDWKAVTWQDRLHKEDDMHEGAMLTDENMLDPEEGTLEELDEAWADELITEEEFDGLSILPGGGGSRFI